MKKRVGIIILVLLLLILAGGGAAFYYYYSKYINIPTKIGAACLPLEIRQTKNNGRSASIYAK